MTYKRHINILVILISLLVILTTSFGIFSGSGPGEYLHESIRGEEIIIYGQGLYADMSADVAIQGIAQDYVSLFIALPLMLISLYFNNKGSLRAKLVLGGMLGYFLVTFTFYMAMAMFNALFLAYCALMGLSFFGLYLVLSSTDRDKLAREMQGVPAKFSGWFLIINSIMIAFLWLSVVLPPLLDGSIYPPELNHYTTLIVQGFDLGLLLPLSFVCGCLLIKGKAQGYHFGTTYLVFLSVLMMALCAKIIAMAIHGSNVVPVIFIIPSICLITIVLSFMMIRGISFRQIFLS